MRSAEMAEKCCGEERDSAFCPQCGRPLIQSPINELIDYLRRTLRATEKVASKWLAASKGKDGREEAVVARCARIAQRKRALADKWKRWLDALLAIKANEKPSPTQEVGEGG
jgi:hypothetical protein